MMDMEEQKRSAVEGLDSEPARQARTISNVEEQAGDLLKRAILGIIRNGYGDLTMRQMAMLLLTKDEGMIVTDLSNEMGISLSSVSRSASTLEKKRLVRRNRPGRNVIISATPKGQAVIGKSVMNVTRKEG